jgi:hypothetical protein
MMAGGAPALEMSCTRFRCYLVRFSPRPVSVGVGRRLIDPGSMVDGASNGLIGGSVLAVGGLRDMATSGLYVGGYFGGGDFVAMRCYLNIALNRQPAPKR